eukprot:2942562-Karenia_brevis.AAC.1
MASKRPLQTASGWLQDGFKMDVRPMMGLFELGSGWLQEGVRMAPAFSLHFSREKVKTPSSSVICIFSRA